jgi:rare lipoprotein A
MRPPGPTPAAFAVCAAMLAAAGCERGQARTPVIELPPFAARAPRAPAQVGEASYYGPGFAGKPTASGEPMNPHALTAASRTLPLGTTAKVTNTETGKSVAVAVNDRGPYAGGRILDLSERAAKRLGMKDDGVARVKVQPLKKPKTKADGPAP